MRVSLASIIDPFDGCAVGNNWLPRTRNPFPGADRDRVNNILLLNKRDIDSRRADIPNEGWVVCMGRQNPTAESQSTLGSVISSSIEISEIIYRDSDALPRCRGGMHSCSALRHLQADLARVVASTPFEIHPPGPLLAISG